MMITPIMSVFFRPSGSPITKVDMAPKKLGAEDASGIARRSARELCAPSDIVERYDCALEVGVWVPHLLEEGVGDDDASEHALVVACAAC